MKKILLAFDGRHYSKGTIEFAANLNEKSPVLLTGVFLRQVDYANLFSYWGGGSAGPMFIPVAEVEQPGIAEENIRQFENFCQHNGIEYRVHKDVKDFALQELKQETRFADLLILSSDTYYTTPYDKQPNDYLKDTLHGVECPVVVLPENAGFPQTTILAYDGSASSVYAIKQFAYLFPEYADNETILVYANEKEGEELPDEVNIEELAARHFSDLTLSRVKGKTGKDLGSWLANEKPSILVCGAYGHSGMPRLFHKSFITDIIKEHKLPVFVAHR